MGSKSTKRSDTTFDRRRSPAPPGAAGASGHPARRATDRRPADAELDDRATKRRATSDGRQPLVVYLRPEAIKALKIAALEDDTSASAIVATAVSTWLHARGKRKRSRSSL